MSPHGVGQVESWVRRKASYVTVAVAGNRNRVLLTLEK